VSSVISYHPLPPPPIPGKFPDRPSRHQQQSVPVSDAPAVRCRGLHKRFGSTIAVRSLDLEVRRGECFGLLGPNGAGKTTTIEILEGLQQPDAGDVEVLGFSWARDADRLRPRLGIQLQDSVLPDKLTVEETVRLFRSFYPAGPAVSELIDLAVKGTSIAEVKEIHGSALESVHERPRIRFTVLRNGVRRQIVLDFSRDYDR
jgi:ABC-type Fe3+/spermidine/putrescine transport system ATPase subunit